MDRYQIAAIQESPAGQRLARRQPLTHAVYQVVVEMLMTHTLEPQARLSIEELARTLGVSPTPVREALARVEADGLIIKEPGRSYTVAPLMGIEQVRELLELRMLVEPAAAAKAATRATPPQITELRSLARTGGANHETNGAANRIDMTYDATFHAMVADVAGNQIIADMLARLRGHLHTYRLYYQADHFALTRSEHVAVVQAVAKRDPEGAEHAMRTHLTAALERMELFAHSATSSKGR
jgi:DNA-binding GntR family transcriptional regulator